MIIQLKNVRLAFPVLFEPTQVNGEGTPAYSAAFLLPPDHPDLPAFKAAMEKVGAEHWKNEWPAVKKALVAGDKLALHDGNTKANYAGYEGNLFVNARNTKRPLVIGRDKTPLTAADGVVYGGCYVNANLELWAQANAYGKRINASLRGVQFVADGDSFGGGAATAAADEFDDLAVPQSAKPAASAAAGLI